MLPVLRFYATIALVALSGVGTMSKEPKKLTKSERRAERLRKG